MNTEEARQALDKLAWSATYDEDEQAVLMEAADDYALAVLDEAEECVVPPSAGWDDEALRDRIQALR